MKNYEYTFEDYASTILPKRVQMVESLIPHAFNVNKLFAQGSGERGVIKKLGRIDDFKGIYAFISKKEVVYVGTSEKVINRLIYHIKGHTKYQAHLAWEIAKTKQYWINKKLEVPDMQRAKDEVKKMQIVFLEVSSPIERYLLEAYAAMHFNCRYNHFDHQ